MSRFNLMLLMTLCVTGCQAFVAHRPIVSVPMQSSMKHFAIDPSHFFDSTSTFLAEATSNADYIPGTSGEVTYSRASYYTILALYLSSFPGLWSTIKRSTSAKVKRKIFVT